jgi:hypothetical protein
MMQWVAIDEDRFMLVPPSTQYPTTVGRWRHSEGCPLDRVELTGCTCTDTTEQEETQR